MKEFVGLRVYLLKERYRKARDATAMKVAYLLPRRLVMWCYIRIACHATLGKYENTVVPELGMMDALQRWETDN
jgi:hypothetical protein